MPFKWLNDQYLNCLRPFKKYYGLGQIVHLSTSQLAGGMSWQIWVSGETHWRYADVRLTSVDAPSVPSTWTRYTEGLRYLDIPITLWTVWMCIWPLDVLFDTKAMLSFLWWWKVVAFYDLIFWFNLWPNKDFHIFVFTAVLFLWWRLLMSGRLICIVHFSRLLLVCHAFCVLSWVTALLYM